MKLRLPKHDFRNPFTNKGAYYADTVRAIVAKEVAKATELTQRLQTELTSLQDEIDKAVYQDDLKKRSAEHVQALTEPHCDKYPKCGCPHVYECIGEK